MAKIGNVGLSIEFPDEASADIDVRYDVVFDRRDTGERYVEVCLMVAHGAPVGEAAAGGDAPADVAALFRGEVEVTGPRTVSRRFAKRVPVRLLDEGPLPVAGAEDLRAVVSLIPVPPTANKAVSRESNPVPGRGPG